MTNEQIEKNLANRASVQAKIAKLARLADPKNNGTAGEQRNAKLAIRRLIQSIY